VQDFPTTSTELHPPPHPGGTIRQLLVDSVRRHADRAAILAPHRSALTYAALGEQIDTVTRALAEAGFGRGHRVAVALPHGPEFAVAVLAICCAATCAPLNDQLTEEALAQVLVAMRVDALIVAAGADKNAARAARRLAIPLLELQARPDAPAGAFEVIAQHRRAPVTMQPPEPDDVVLVTHTSGTTGAPKIMPFEHWRMAESARSRVPLVAIEPADRCLFVVPFYTTVAIRRGLLPALIVGSSVICPPVLDAQTLVSVLETMQPTQLMAPPVVLIAMLEEFEHRRPRPKHVLRFITSSFAELAPAVRQRLELDFGVPVVVSYGMAECGSIAETPLPPGAAPLASVGRPSLLDVAVADAAGRFLGHDQVGEIVVRGREVFRGYENNEEANRAAFRDGWFRTGDAGRIDRDGFVFLVGRIKDIINRGGIKIAPAEVQEALEQHPSVAEAAAFGVPHPTLGEDVVAAVVLRDPRLTEVELRRFVRSRLAAFKLPSRILPLAELPRGTLGKVNRIELARIAQSMAAADFEPPRAGAETEIARIFAEVLEVPSVGRTGNFFHLGGDSLRAVRVLASVEAAFGARTELDLLFDHPTVAEFAARIVDMVPAKVRPESPGRTDERP